MAETSKKQVRDSHGRLTPGHTANPNGRPPKGYSITEAFRSMLSADPEAKKQIVESIKSKALQGDSAAQKLVWNYMDGLPPASSEDPGSPENPIHHEHRVIWE